MAQGPDDLKREARRLGEAALQLYEQERWQQAYDKFTEADRVFHAPTLVLYRARSMANMGQVIEARELYRLLLREAVQPKAPPQFREAKDVAFRELEAIDKRIPAVLIRLQGTAAARATIRVDGEIVSRKAAIAPVELNPGPHQIRVTADGAEDIVEDFELPDADAVVELDLVIGRAAEAVVPPAAISPGTGPTYVPAAIAFSVGGAGLVAGAVTGALVLSSSSDIKSRCRDGHCLPEDESKGDDATVMAHVSTASFVLGGVGVIAGLALVIWAPGGEDSNARLSVGPTGATLGMRF
ncbi:MAG TPA: hypothetical protein ENK57_25170 [Polyangiaceae bacterium]|nr:hypothetical protein [Polyangiaceae bacterium]